MRKKIAGMIMLVMIVFSAMPASAAIRKVIKIYDDHDRPHEYLNAVSEEVTRFDESLQYLVTDLIDTLKAEGDEGLYLSAPQVGVNKRVCVARFKGDEYTVMINPRVVEKSGKQIGTEGCLSLPNVFKEVERPQSIVVECVNENNDPVTLKLKDFEARVAMHMIDHLDGKMITNVAVSNSGTMLSEGSIRIIIACVALMAGLAAGFFIGSNRKKEPVTVNDTLKSDSDDE